MFQWCKRDSSPFNGLLLECKLPVPMPGNKQAIQLDDLQRGVQASRSTHARQTNHLAEHQRHRHTDLGTCACSSATSTATSTEVLDLQDQRIEQLQKECNANYALMDKEQAAIAAEFKEHVDQQNELTRHIHELNLEKACR